MAEVKRKAAESEQVMIEEESGVIEQISPSKNEKRKREEDADERSPNKYKHTADGSRAATTSSQRNSLTVPFWKNLNRRQSSTEFHSTEIGTFSLLTRDNTKECFDDKRYLRSNSSAENEF